MNHVTVDQQGIKEDIQKSRYIHPTVSVGTWILIYLFGVFASRKKNIFIKSFFPTSLRYLPRLYNP